MTFGIRYQKGEEGLQYNVGVGNASGEGLRTYGMGDLQGTYLLVTAIVYCLVTCPDCQFCVKILVLCMIHVHLHMCYLLPNLFTACAWFNWF